MSIGKRISELRKSKKITQQKLSELANVDYNTLRKIETGKTKSPSPDFIEKVSHALNIKSSQLLDEPKPNTQGGDILPFLQLSADRFEQLITWILEKYDDFVDVEPYGSRGDKKRDLIAKKISGSNKAEKATLFQAKRYQKTDSTTLINELKGIKKHFFDTSNPATPIEAIIFCLADSPSATIKDKVKLYASSNNLPEPIFWEARTLDVFCKGRAEIMNEFFGGHNEELKKGHDDIKKMLKKQDGEIKKGIQLQNEGLDSLQRIESKMVTVTSADDAEMQKARRLISDKKYDEAQEILLTLKDKIEHSSDNERLKKLYNNLGLCFSKAQTEGAIDKGIEYLKKALDLDEAFCAPKQNLIEIIINSGLKAQYDYALELAKKLYDFDSNNLEYVGLYIHVLSACEKYDDAKNLIKISESKISENEAFCAAAILLYLKENLIDDAAKLIDAGLKNFPDSVFLNRFKGVVLMMEAEHGGTKSRDFDIVPFFQKINLVEEAVEYFKKALDLAIAGSWPRLVKSQLGLALYNTLIILRRNKSQNIDDLQFLQKIDSGIEMSDLSLDERKNKLIMDASKELEQERNYNEAFNLFRNFLDEFTPMYDDIKEIAKKFLQHGSPEFAVKILLPIMEESKDQADFEYWAMLSMCYTLMDDKNSALRVMNDAKAYFASADKVVYRKVLSHYGALAARYQDNSESERLVKNMFELQDITPEETIMQPVKAIEEDGSLSNEIKDFFANAKKDFEGKRDLFKSTPLPIYFLKTMFRRSFPESLTIPSSNYDFEFVLPYNALDKDFLAKQKSHFEENDTFVLDYSALLNFSRSGQLSLLSALGKKLVASEYLLFEVQVDLMSCESRILRDAWNFLRNGDVKLFSFRDIKKGSVPKKMQEFFDLWLIQEMDYCIKEKAVLLTDDLRLWHYMYSAEIGAKAINSFIFFQEALKLGALDKKQYSLAIAELADVFYHFIPFNGEDLLNIVLDDDNRIRNKTIGWLSFKTESGEFKISRRTYHLLNQVKLPGSEVISFLVVCLDFLNRLMRLSVLEEEKIDWVLFLTNFFGEFVSEDNLKTHPDLFDNHLKFVVQSWLLLVKNIPDSSRDAVIKKTEEIKNDNLKIGIRNALSQLK